MMKTNFLLLMTFALFSGLADANPAELLENGNFKQRANYWTIMRNVDYGEKGKLRISNKVLSAKKLVRSGTWYLVVAQPVNIKKDRKYKLSFDMMGKAKGGVQVGVGHPAKEAHFWEPAIEPSPMWKTHVVEFTGKFDTDEEWLSYQKEQYKKNKILDGLRTKWEQTYPVKDELRDPPSRSRLSFGLGDVVGDVMIRNVSIVEVK